MNNQSPLIPQGSFLEQRNKTRTRVKIAVIFVLGLHGIGLLALLMQGCGKETATSPSTTPTSNTAAANPAEMGPSNPAPGFAPPSNAMPETASAMAGTGAAPAAAAAASNQVQPPLPTENTNVSAGALLAGATEYKIIRGDTLSKVARKFHVALKALMAVNPGVDSTKLNIGQTIHIPPATTSAAAPGGTGTAPAATTEGAGGQQVYTVESGDYLIKIANQFGVKVEALRAANNLKSAKIRVGQKLKIPAKTAGTAAAPAAASAGATSGAAATGSVTAPAILPGR
ncbi:MAG: LysM peptidoglycan-binding domain-containing protein [Verrucomicrobiota bacterium]|jgi:LysM repeat protein